MPRWDPDARDRLESAALQLFGAVGYDDTTVSDIASSAGVTRRTYFRYFPDKREVLFGGSEALRSRLRVALRDAPTGLEPFAMALGALGECGDHFTSDRRDDVASRERIIMTSADLQERENHKLASMAADISTALAERGCESGWAVLLADLALVIFKRASELWMSDDQSSFQASLDRALVETRRLITS